jgi:hypothetical protein
VQAKPQGLRADLAALPKSTVICVLLPGPEMGSKTNQVGETISIRKLP